jgi:hypothetical protein
MQDGSSMSKFRPVLLLIGLFVLSCSGRGPAIIPLPAESVIPVATNIFGVYHPAQVVIGWPFSIYVDYDKGCLYNSATKIGLQSDMQTMTLGVELSATEVGSFGCPGTVALDRFAVTLTLDKLGVWAVNAFVLGKTESSTLEVVLPNKAIPIWAGPPPRAIGPSVYPSLTPAPGPSTSAPSSGPFRAT